MTTHLHHHLRLVAVALAALAIDAAAVPTADLVFRRGAVFTVDNDRPWAESVAVRGDTIVYVGDDSGVAEYIGNKTKIVDLKGRMLLPGFIDSHVHISTADSLPDASLALRDRPPADVLNAIRIHVEENPGQAIVRGTGWIPETFAPFGPDKKDLDAIVSDRPAVMDAIDSHHLWINSKALELAGITADTPDPDPGKSWFQRYPGSREPTGFIVEGKAMRMVREGLAKQGFPLRNGDRFVRGLELGLPLLSSAGITTVFDAGMRSPENDLATLHEFERQGRLSLRVFSSYRFTPTLGAKGKDPIAEVMSLRSRYDSDKLFAARQIKVALDGSENNYTAFMLEPYADRPQSRGLPLFPQQQLNALLISADANDIDVHMHVVGDAGARMGLDAVEQAIIRNGSRERRHTLSHVIFVHPDDIPRFRRLGVLWQSTPSWALPSTRNDVVRAAMGDHRFNFIYPFRQALIQGALLTFGSDFGSLNPGAVFKPLEQIEVGHTRRRLGQEAGPILPSADQRLDLSELIRAYTINGAYMLRMENKLGSITVGKKADLVLLEKNLFDVAPHEIHRTRVLMTVMDGRLVYSEESGTL